MNLAPDEYSPYAYDPLDDPYEEPHDDPDDAPAYGRSQDWATEAHIAAARARRIRAQTADFETAREYLAALTPAERVAALAIAQRDLGLEADHQQMTIHAAHLAGHER